MEACCLIVVAFFAICIGLEYIENSIKEGKKREAERQRQEYERVLYLINILVQEVRVEVMMHLLNMLREFVL